MKDEKSQLQIYMITEMLILMETGGNRGKHVVWSEMLTVRKKRSMGNKAVRVEELAALNWLVYKGLTLRKIFEQRPEEVRE